MKKTKPLVIVLSRNYSTGLGIIRSLGAAGYQVDLIASVKKKGSSIIASSSKYVRNTVEVLSTKIQGDTGENLIAELKEYAQADGEKAVLFPADDFTASVISANYNKLKAHFYLPYTTCPEKTCVDLMDKKFQAEVARSVGLNTPYEWIVSLNDEVALPSDVIYPCFVKPIQSFAGHKTEMAVCQNDKELRNQLLKMKVFYSNRDVLIQEYLQIDKEYDLSGVCLDQEIILPAVIEKTQIAKYERGVTMTGKMMPMEELGDAAGKITALLRRFHYMGMIDLELNLCGDKLYFNEVNLRSGGPNYSYFLNGVNLPEIFVKAICGEHYNQEAAAIKAYGKTFVYEKVAWEDYIHGYITKDELKRCLKEADFALLANTDDPEPGKYFSRRIRLSCIKRKVKMSLKRGIRKNNEV